MDVHAIFLRDSGTQNRFQKAISEVVRRGDVVLDLGTGTGIHAIFACRAGASRVYAVDRDDVVHLARKIADDNGCGDRVVCLQGALPQVVIPEPADVVVTNQGFGDALRMLATARERFLKPGGRLIPSTIRLSVVPLEAARAYGQAVRFWTRPHYEIDFAAAQPYATNALQDLTFSSTSFLAKAAALPPIDLASPLPAIFTWSATFRISRPGVMHGTGAWLDYRLSPGVTLSTRPPMAVASPPWQHVLFPLDEARRVSRGDRVQLELKLSVQPGRNVWAWNVTASRRSGHRVSTLFAEAHSTLAGLPLGPDLLRKLSPDHAPALHEWGEARRTVLDLCDGRRSLREIELEMQVKHPGLFPSLALAQGFVAEIVSQDAR